VNLSNPVVEKLRSKERTGGAEIDLHESGGNEEFRLRRRNQTEKLTFKKKQPTKRGRRPGEEELVVG